MKRSLSLLLVLICLMLLCACGKQTQENEAAQEAISDTFVGMEYVGHDNSCTYYFDVVTDVMYIHYRVGYAGGITGMLDTDGTPLTHTRYVELCAERAGKS